MNKREIYLAGGCFWGTEHYFKQIEGVVETSVGFANGHTENPTYKEVVTVTSPSHSSTSQKKQNNTNNYKQLQFNEYEKNDFKPDGNGLCADSFSAGYL